MRKISFSLINKLYFLLIEIKAFTFIFLSLERKSLLQFCNPNFLKYFYFFKKVLKLLEFHAYRSIRKYPS